MFKVVVVEDQEFIANAIAEMIRTKSDQFVIEGIYYNGKECLESIRNSPPDILITDIRMPEMDGITLSKKIIELFPAIKILILSGYEDFQYAKEAIKIGVSNYLLKPCHVDELLAALNEVCSQLEKEYKKEICFQKYENLFINNLPTLRQQALIASIFTEEKIINPEELGLDYLIPKSQLILIDVNISSLQNIKDEELHLFCCGNMLQEILASSFKQMEFFLCNGKFVFIAPIDDIFTEKNIICVQKACKKVESIVHNPIAFYDGGILHSLEECKNCYNDALENSKINTRILEETTQQKEAQSIIEQAKNFIKENYYKDISLQDVADNSYVSYNYLSTLFTQDLGVSFSVYLTKIRIEKACILLKDHTIRVSDVSEKIGYHNYRYFNHVFKKMTGYTPSEYRRKK